MIGWPLGRPFEVVKRLSRHFMYSWHKMVAQAACQFLLAKATLPTLL